MSRWDAQNNWKKRNRDKYRVLCMDCNFSLGAWGYCPHEIERQQSVSNQLTPHATAQEVIVQ